MSEPERPKITLERRYQATAEDVWNLWTTKAGIESWWGPEGFTVTVQHLDLQVGGELRYTMTATGADQVAFVQQAGMPLATEVSVTYTEMEPMSRLGYVSSADFVPGTPAYEVATTIVLSEDSEGVRIELTFDAMHDEEWTGRAVMGRESALDRPGGILAARR